MVEGMRKENEKLKTDNRTLSEKRTQLTIEEETLDIRLKTILREK